VDIRDFLSKVHRPDAKLLKKKVSKNNVVKFKLRCSRYLYTLKVTDAQKANKIWQSLPPGLKKEEIGKKK
jgi:large subunit ribosomal protein L38e